jgi:hypothetical protein
LLDRVGLRVAMRPLKNMDPVLVTRVAEVIEAVERIGTDLAPPLTTPHHRTDGPS